LFVLLLALIAGVLIGLVSQISIPAVLLSYLGVAILAALDSCLGGVRAALERTFSDRIFVFGFLTNTLMAAFIVYIGERIGVRELYLAAVVAFGVRLFNNLGAVRRLLIDRPGAE